MTDPRDPADLVRAAAQGDEAAWKALVERYSGRVWAVARGLKLSTADAADVAQTVWLILVENLGRLRDPSSVGAWLATTTRRECLRLLNRQAREVPKYDLEDATGAAVDRTQEDIDQGLLARERQARVRAAFETLSERCQELLRLLLREPPLAYTDIGGRLGMPVGSIGPTRGRCLDLLRGRLDFEI